MTNYLLIGALVFGLFFGFSGKNIISNLNPFKSSAQVQKSENEKEEYFRDQIKGIEYRVKEKSKNQTPSNTGNSIGMRIGRFIDSSIQLVIGFFVVGLVILFLTGFNLFKFVSNKLKQLNNYRKTLKQTVQAIENAKPKMNGSEEILKTELSKSMDTESKRLIDDLKRDTDEK